MNDLISVVIPFYNREDTIELALKSVLLQEHKNIEIVLVNDNSNDNSVNLIKKYKDDRIKLINLKRNSGACRARNEGIKNSNGKYIAFLDSDDFWHKSKLRKQYEVFSNYSNIDVVHCGVRYLDYKTRKEIYDWTVRYNVKSDIRKTFGAAPSTSSLVIKKDVLEDVGYFDEKLPAHQETDLSIRISKKYNYKLVDEILVFVLTNHNQISSDGLNRIRAKEYIYKKHKDYLDDELLSNICKNISSYYLCRKDLPKGLEYLRNSLKHRKDLKLEVINFISSIYPTIIPTIYNKLSKAKSL